MKIAWVSPLPPSPSGIADYSADLLPSVSALAETVALTTEPDWQSDSFLGEVHPLEDLPTFIERGFLPIYHQGNNRHHKSIFELATQYPGLLVLHDVVLHHFLLDRAERSKDWSGYKEALEEQYPDHAVDLFRLSKSRVITELDKFLWPMSGPLIRRSVKTIVHSHYAADLVKLECPEAEVSIILHHLGVPPKKLSLTSEEVRNQLDLGSDFLVGSFGYVTGPKQGNVLLKAIHKMRMEGIPASAVFVGADESRGSMKALVEELGIGPFVRFTGYLERDDFYSYISAVDVVIALRYPSAGETSGTLSRALSMGKCVLVGDYATLAEVPSDACMHVPVFGEMADAVVECLEQVFSNEGLRGRIESGAMKYAEQELSLESCASQYVAAAKSLSAADEC